MKLITISEANPTRRDFLKQTGAAIVNGKKLFNILAKLEIPSDVIQNIVESDKLFITTTLVGNQHGRSVDGEYKEFMLGIRHLLALCGKKEQDMVICCDEDSINGYLEISKDNFAHFLKGKEVYEDENNNLHVQGIDANGYNNDYYVGTSLNEIIEGSFGNGQPEILSDPLKQFWGLFGRYGSGPISDGMFKALKNMNLDPTDRCLNKEDVAECLLQSKEDIGDLSKYGLTDDDMIAAKQKIENWKNEVRSPNTRVQGDITPDKISPRPDDEIWGSSMHQPMENKHKLSYITELSEYRR